MKDRQAVLLRIAFLAGSVTDGVALLPMLFPPLANLLLGHSETSASYRFAMNYAAALMFGWTALLAWAYRRPIERRFVAALTALVILGLVLAEVVAVRAGVIGGWRMAPTWFLQAALLLLFAAAYRYPFRRVSAKGDNRRT